MNTTLETVNQFIDWTQFKMTLDHSGSYGFPRKKEIWWASLGRNVGVEINGKNQRFERPVIVIIAFNAESFLVIPISSKIKNHEYLYKFVGNTGEENVAVLSQPRSVSIKRFLRKVGEIDDITFNDIVDRFIGFLHKTKVPLCGTFSESSTGGSNETETPLKASSELPEGNLMQQV